MTIHRQLAALSRGLEGRLDEIWTVLAERMRGELPGIWETRDIGLEHALQRGVRDHVGRVVRELGRGREPLAELTPPMWDEVQAAARARVAVEDLLHTRRLAQSVTWEALIDETYATELAADARADLLKAASRFLFADVDRALALLRAAYDRERTARTGDRGRRSERLVKDVLSGLPVDSGDLGYDLHGRHLCAMAWGAAPEAAIDTLAAELGARQRLLSAAGDSSVRAWIAVGAGVCEPAPQLPPGSSCAIGEPADGVEGFRATHRQAHSAYRVGLRRPVGSFTRYRDVALTALATADDAAARDFVAHWLGPLAGDDDPRMTVLRTTLATYFAVGQNALAAASRLGVNDRTVAYRLRRIEDDVLDTPIATVRDELAVALRLHALAGERPVEREGDSPPSLSGR